MIRGMSDGPETLRERRRRETSRHIAEVGLRLFEQQGYDETTMQVIAEAAGVAPRTLFHYFATKDQLLRHWIAGGFAEDLGAAVLVQSPDLSPLEAVRTALLSLVTRHETPESLVVDRVLNSTPGLRASKQATFVEWEQMLAAVLEERYGTRYTSAHLRLVALVSIGALRLALEQRRHEPAPGAPLVQRLEAMLDEIPALAGDSAR
jgi:AcrR family transcriptional regulator